MTLLRAALRRVAPGLHGPLVIPSAPPIPRPLRRPSILALLSVRDEMRFLPGLIENLALQVDGVVAFDDGSSDGSGEYLACQEIVLEVVHGPAERGVFDEAANYMELVTAALRYQPDWLLVIDADERLERDFRPRAERVIWLGSLLGLSDFSVRIRELWDDPTTYRSDGIWGRKPVGRLFRARPDHEFDRRPLHCSKVPLQARRIFGGLPLADLNVYHLRMLRAEDREMRRRRYETLDPGALFQPELGYAYLTDVDGLELTPVPYDRGYDG